MGLGMLEEIPSHILAHSAIEAFELVGSGAGLGLTFACSFMWNHANCHSECSSEPDCDEADQYCREDWEAQRWGAYRQLTN